MEEEKIMNNMKKIGAAIFCAVFIVALGTGLIACGSAQAAAGDVIKLGGIDWRVLDVKDGKALVLSDKILAKRAYHEKNLEITWEKCDLRQYLNGQFYDATFSVEEKGRIAETAVSTNDNRWTKASGGNDTNDKVFLLSMEETMQYLGDIKKLDNDDALPMFINDDFSEKRVAKTQEGNAAGWWLRSPGYYCYECGNNSSTATIITSTGALGVVGDYVENEKEGVRPALWVKL
jgi:hypothetical protein